jgi:hypothetical protein
MIAGWSSPVARWAHNPKVSGSNPDPATNKTEKASHETGLFCFHLWWSREKESRSPPHRQSLFAAQEVFLRGFWTHTERLAPLGDDLARRRMAALAYKPCFGDIHLGIGRMLCL